MVLGRGKMGVLAAATMMMASTAMVAAPTVRAVASVQPLARLASSRVFASPPTTAQCMAQLGINCYSPQQFQTAYDLSPLYQQGVRGEGRSIVIADAFGSPTIQQDLQTFDQAFGLPDPKLSILQPSGAVPAYDPNGTDRFSWALETTLDVEIAHAMAPGAAITLLETPVDETEGVTGLPELMDAEKYAVDHNLGDVISQSFGATEETFPGPADIMRLRYAFTDAARHNVTVLASTGDQGATAPELDLTTLYPYRVTNWPATDPLVTAVGGTQLFLDAAGHRTQPDRVWNDGYGAGGGGSSSVFSRPGYQNGVSGTVGAQRGIPDISLSAAVNGGAILYQSFDGHPGYIIVGGTSESSPMLAGMVALAAQLAGHRLGQINPTLYGLLGAPNSGEKDITLGNNSFAGVVGYKAVHGYDLASGVGTPIADELVPNLAGK